VVRAGGGGGRGRREHWRASGRRPARALAGVGLRASGCGRRASGCGRRASAAGVSIGGPVRASGLRCIGRAQAWTAPGEVGRSTRAGAPIWAGAPYRAGTPYPAGEPIRATAPYRATDSRDDSAHPADSARRPDQPAPRRARRQAPANRRCTARPTDPAHRLTEIDVLLVGIMIEPELRRSRRRVPRNAHLLSHIPTQSKRQTCRTPVWLVRSRPTGTSGTSTADRSRRHKPTAGRTDRARSVRAATALCEPPRRASGGWVGVTGGERRLPREGRRPRPAHGGTARSGS
jgi:hypothetical protein